MIAPRTLSNFQSLTKLIALIINHFYSHCRGDWQIALTKQNFSQTHSKMQIKRGYLLLDILFLFVTEPPTNCTHFPFFERKSASLQLLSPIQNSKNNFGNSTSTGFFTKKILSVAHKKPTP